MEKKKIMLCFYKGDINKDLKILEGLDRKGFEVHLYNDVDESNIKYDILLDVIKDLFGTAKEHYDIYVSSNVKEFIMLQYILYRDWIAAALYLNKNPAYFELEDLYQLILKTNLDYHSSNFYLLKAEEGLINNCHIFNGNFGMIDYTDVCGNVAYNYKGESHIFSISNDDDVKIINLDNSQSVRSYRYHFNLNYIDDFLKEISYCANDTNFFINSHSRIISEISELKNRILNALDLERRMIGAKLDNQLYENENNDIYKVFLSSILLNVFSDNKYLLYLIKLVIESKYLNKKNKFFAYYQFIRYIFINRNSVDESILSINRELYNSIFEEFNSRCKKYSRIKKEERNKDIVFVFTGQFLSIDHAPTKIALDVCYNFINDLNKKVILINTKEVLTTEGLIPMADIVSANINNMLNSTNRIAYKNIEIPFYQPDCNMPNEDEIQKVLEMVVRYSPHLIINIGTNLIGDLCTNIVPAVMLTMGRDQYSKSTFLVVNNESEVHEYCKKFHRDIDSFIVSKLAFELKSKVSTYTKEQLQIPQNKFIISVIGNRLNEEIDEEFLDVLNRSCKNNNAYILFIDKFDFTDFQVNKYKHLIKNYKNIGYQQDLLAILENVDLYVNPNRRGGGTSAIYAMYLGKPVVTLEHGDVATNAGSEFYVKNYEEMTKKIGMYQNNKEFYYCQAHIAKSKALKLIDTVEYVRNIYIKVIESHLF